MSWAPLRSHNPRYPLSGPTVYSTTAAATIIATAPAARTRTSTAPAQIAYAFRIAAHLPVVSLPILSDNEAARD